jgi:hypothetical protein
MNVLNIKTQSRRNKMKIKPIITTWVGLIVLVFLVSSPLIANSLELTIKPRNNDFYPGYPVIFFVSLKNVTYEMPMNIVSCLEPEYGFVEYIVKTPEGKEFTFVPWAYKEHPDPVKRLSSGESFRTAAKLFFGANGWTFTTPGEYVIKAVYMKEVVSNEWIISIFTPLKFMLPVVNSFLENPDLGLFLLLEGGDHLEAKKLAEKIGDEYARTSYGAYCNFALGVNLMHDFADFKSNRLRKANIEAAIPYLEKAKLRVYGFYKSIYATIHLADAYEKTGQPEKAKTVIQDFITSMDEAESTFPDFPQYREFLYYFLKKEGKWKEGQ